jgi:hypothetical protein
MRKSVVPLVALALLLALSLARAEEREQPTSRSPGPDGGVTSVPLKNDVTRAQVRAVSRGLEYLARSQNSDGSFNENPHSNVAVTALAVLAYMANGNSLSKGRYQEQVRRGIRYLLQSVRMQQLPGDRFRRGYIDRDIDPQSRMHGHGYATMALALAYGSIPPDSPIDRRDYRYRLTLAIECTEASQDDSGGWGYLPHPTLHEGSVTVTQVWALRAARDAGFKVNRTVIDKAIRYLEASHDPETGGFCYSLDSRSQQTFALTAAALSTLFGLGEYGRRGMIGRGIEYMKRWTPASYKRRPQWFYYGSFYAAQALWQAEATDWAGNYWKKWWPKVRDYLVHTQSRSDGAWPAPSGESTWGVASAYATSMSVLILTVPLEILPIYQR